MELIMIYDYQKDAYQKLFKTAIAHKIAMGKKLPVSPRFHKLVVGPSGTGKTHLAKTIAHVLGWRVLTLNMAGWIVLGARETPTWHTVGEWLSESHPDEPQMIILDEIDKVSSEDSWTRYLRAEVYSLVDGLVPPQVVPGNIESETLTECINQTLIIGCGAFQHAFESKPSAGFVSSENYPTISNDLSKHLARELVNRFDSEIIILPHLSEADYNRMIQEVLPHLPNDIAEIIKEISPQMIRDAITNKLGARFMENLIAAAYLENVDTVIDIYEKFESESKEQNKIKEVEKEKKVENSIDLEDITKAKEEIRKVLKNL
jgi:hypothetical protein